MSTIQQTELQWREAGLIKPNRRNEVLQKSVKVLMLFSGGLFLVGFATENVSVHEVSYILVLLAMILFLVQLLDCRNHVRLLQTELSRAYGATEMLMQNVNFLHREIDSLKNEPAP